MQNPPGDTFARGPWHELPAALGALIRTRIDAIAADMVEAIRQEVPAYRSPLDSAMGRDLIDSVCRAMRQFAELTEAPESSQDHHVRHFRHLGRVEFLNGRTTDGIQAAFRVGARVGSRRYAEVARTASLPTEIVLPLHEAVLTHINALANESVKGFVAAQARAEGETQRNRRALAQALLERPRGTPGEPLDTLAARARWPLPAKVACLVVRQAAGGRFALPGQGRDVLTLPRGADLVVVLPEPDGGGPAGTEDVRAAVRGRTAALGPAVVPHDAWLSLVCARLALNHHRDTGAPDDGLLVVGDRLADVHLLGGAHIGRLLGDHVLGALDGLPAGRAARLAETLEALLMSWGRTAPEVARALGIHPQTARKRLRQLDALFEGRLADPGFRFGALLALRTRALRR